MMRYSKGDNEFEEKGESILSGSTNLDLRKEEAMLERNRLLYRIWRETGIHPTEFTTVGEYVEAVLLKTSIETLVNWDGIEEGESINPLVKEELKKRGEI